MSKLEATLALAVGACEGALLMAKQLALDQGFRQGCAVYLDLWPVGPGTPLVDHARDEFLSHPGLPLQQHGGVRFCHLLHSREDVFHSVALADDLVESLDLKNLLSEIEVFFFQPLLQATDFYQRRVKILFGPLTLSDIKHHTHPACAALAKLTNGPAS